MVIYHRQEVLECDCDFATLHNLLVHLSDRPNYRSHNPHGHKYNTSVDDMNNTNENNNNTARIISFAILFEEQIVPMADALMSLISVGMLEAIIHATEPHLKGLTMTSTAVAGKKK